jgi:phage/plasmid-associated DNA primase
MWNLIKKLFSRETQKLLVLKEQVKIDLSKTTKGDRKKLYACWKNYSRSSRKRKIMPLTKKGKKIKAAMTKEYGAKKAEKVFYASKNKGVIKGVEKKSKKRA